MLYLELGDLTGEGSDDLIELTGWSQSVSRSGLMNRAMQHSAQGTVSFSPIAVDKYVDSATPDLVRLCAKGQVIPEATITKYTAVDGKQPIFSVKLKKVRIGSVDVNVGGGSGPAVERVSLTYGQIDYLFYKYDGNGQPTEFPAGYDVEAEAAT